MKTILQVIDNQGTALGDNLLAQIVAGATLAHFGAFWIGKRHHSDTREKA